MHSIENYEIAISEIQENDVSTPIMALCFGWEDLPAATPLPWDTSNSSFSMQKEGVAITLNGQALLFPLADQGLDTPNAISRTLFLDCLAQHENKLFVCAFDSNGEMVASIGFTPPTH